MKIVEFRIGKGKTIRPGDAEQCAILLQLENRLEAYVPITDKKGGEKDGEDL